MVLFLKYIWEIFGGMKKNILFLFYLMLVGGAQAQDSLVLNTEVGLYNRYIWRGINFGDAPSLQGLCSVSYKGFEVGTYGANSLNGTPLGYANTVELFATYTYKKFSFTIDDYFFYESYDSLNRFFEYGKNTLHFLEARAKFTHDKFYLLAGYNFYSRASNDTKGIYFEAGYNINKQIKLVAGGITQASFLNFHDKGGITNIGIYFKRPVKVTESFSFNTLFALIANPNFEQVAKIAGVSRNPLHFLLSLTF